MINRTGNATLMLKGQNQLHLLTLALQPFSPSACVFLLVFSFKYIYIYSNLLHLLILQFSDCRIKSSLYLLRTRLADNNKLIIGNITGKKNPEPHLVVTSLMPLCLGHLLLCSSKEKSQYVSCPRGCEYLFSSWN